MRNFNAAVARPITSPPDVSDRILSLIGRQPGTFASILSHIVGHPATTLLQKESLHGGNQARSSEDRLQHPGSLPGVQLGQDYDLQSYFDWPPARCSRWWQDDHPSRGAACPDRGGGVNRAPQRKPDRKGPGFPRFVWRLDAGCSYPFRLSCSTSDRHLRPSS